MISYGGRVEYMVADDFGIGADINYEVSGFNYNDTRSVYDETTMTYVDSEVQLRLQSEKIPCDGSFELPLRSKRSC